MSKIIVFGASGQLGQCLKQVAAEMDITDIAFPNETEGNILNPEALQALFAKHQPKYVINCAAYTAVDKAEEELDLARKINKTGVENIAALCRQFDAALVQISTDFVFEGNSPHPLVETDPANPISVYGLTKLEGEQIIADYTEKYFILRTSWLYSEHGNNFVKTMLKLGNDRDELKIIADQIGSPTYAIDLASAVLQLIESGSNAYGLYHYSNEGVTSWYDFAQGIFDISKTDVKTYPIRTSEYPTKATRPAYSVMDKAKIKKTFGIEIPYWRHSLERCIQALQNQ
ncbi:dTDP-4-dehydrorhamnose reductase [Mucilaginibacter sp.]|uniref:dTDP-4-dehydrorhamnose reductase n=1 Tax=Mucilaginibacter sp. TaxID=1882438 RepID=UPI003B000F46